MLHAVTKFQENPTQHGGGEYTGSEKFVSFISEAVRCRPIKLLYRRRGWPIALCPFQWPRVTLKGEWGRVIFSWDLRDYAPNAWPRISKFGVVTLVEVCRVSTGLDPPVLTGVPSNTKRFGISSWCKISCFFALNISWNISWNISEIFQKFHDVEQRTTSIKIHPIQTNKSAVIPFRVLL